MNTRVQVEHCVTEMVTGIDIVKEGIRAAAGRAALATRRSDVELRGHAIECRINAENAAKNFAPAPGKIGAYREPAGPGVRVDSGVGAGGEVSPDCTTRWSPSSSSGTSTARRRRSGCSARSSEYEIEGLTTLIPFHDALLATEQWANARDLPRPRRGQGLAEVDGPRPGARAADRRRRRAAGDRRAVVHRRGLRPALRRQRHRPGVRAARSSRAARRGAPARRKKSKRSERKAGGAGGPDLLEAPLQGNMWKVVVEKGADRRGGPAPLHHRGDEDGERDHRPQGGRDRGARRSRRAPPIQAGDPIARIVSAAPREPPGSRDRRERAQISAIGARASVTRHDRRTARLGGRRRRGRDGRAAAGRLPRPPRQGLAERQRVPRGRRQAHRGPEHRLRHRRARTPTRRPPASSPCATATASGRHPRTACSRTSSSRSTRAAPGWAARSSRSRWSARASAAAAAPSST